MAYLQVLASMIRGVREGFGMGVGWERLRSLAYLGVLASTIRGERKSFGVARGWEKLRSLGDLKDRGGHAGTIRGEHRILRAAGWGRVRRLARRLAKCGATKEALASLGSRYRVGRLSYDTAARNAMEWGA